MTYCTVNNRRGRNDLGTLMDSMMKEFWTEEADRKRYRTPVVNILKEKDLYIVEAELPGMTQEDLELKVENDVLSIRASKKEKTDGKTEYLLKESFSRDYRRDFQIPEDVDSEKIEAKFQDGILKVTLGKKEEKKPRSIRIDVA